MPAAPLAAVVVFVALLASASAGPEWEERGPGHGGSASIVVGATVVPSARLELERQESTLTVTPEDVVRGFVEVRPAMTLVVRTNSPSGYVVSFKITSDMIRAADVYGLAREARVGSGGGRVLQATRGPVQEKLDLGFRFHLSEGAAPGVYSWPVTVTVTATTT